MSITLDLETIFAQVKDAGAADVDKVAEAQSTSDVPSDIEKLAEEFRAGGELFADALVDRALAKLAEQVPAGGGGVEPRSLAEQIADRIAKNKGKDSKPGDDTSVRAEADPTPGATGVANPATALG